MGPSQIWLPCILAVSLGTAAVRTQAPVLVKSQPASGATGVAFDVGRIVFEFDRDMDRTQWSFCQSARGVYPPQVAPGESPWLDARRCELRFGKLAAGTTYAIQLNSEQRKGFRSAEGARPLPVTVVTFSTAAECAGEQPGSVLAKQLVGTWLLRTKEVELRAEFSADGRWKRSLRTDSGLENNQGTWKVQGSALECKVEGEDEVLRFEIKLPNADTLELWENAESGVSLIRQAKSEPAQRPTVNVAPPKIVVPEGKPQKPGGSSRQPLPAGWTAFEHPFVGIQAQIPPEFWARMQGGSLFTVEHQDASGTLAFVMPVKPRGGATAQQIAEHFARFAAQAEPKMRSELLASSPERALTKFTSVHRGKPVEGRTCTVLAAGGSMGFVIGIMAPSERFAAERPVLERIARGFGFVPPRGRWIEYRSPAGGFTMQLPNSFGVESSDGKTPKDDIDWVAFDPQKPLSRVFQWCPRVCSPSLMQDPVHAMRGYQAGGFQDHKQAVVASLGQLAQDVKLVKLTVNEPVTQLFVAMTRDIAGFMGALGVGTTDVVVYDCLAEAKLNGKPVLVAFLATLQTMTVHSVFGPAVDWHITLRGWCAEPSDFVNDSPVLEKACGSMQLSAAFLRRVMEGNEKAVDKIRETYAYMNEVDRQIRDRHWDTMGAIAEMNYDNLRDYGGYVNEKTGRIEQIPPDKVVKNSSGEYVSREEFERGVPLDQCTVVRGAFSDDYMRGAYGRIEFNPW